AEALDHMLRRRGVVRVVAAIPAPRGEPLERLVDARNPGSFRSAGVAHEAACEQLGKALVEGARQLLDESRLTHIDVNHREVAVEPQARRGERAAVPR